MNSPSGGAPTARSDLGDDRRKHLEFIQQVIGRMSSTSATAKSWSLTVAIAVLGYALTKNAPSVAMLGILSVLLFSFMDARYLREERKFRTLYEDARMGGIDAYDMRTGPYIDKSGPKYDAHCAWNCVYRSWSLLGFYGPLLLVATIALVRALLLGP